MKGNNYESGSRILSKRDQDLQRVEVKFDIEDREKLEAAYDAMIEHIRLVIEDYFPSLAQKFNCPDYAKFVESLRASERMMDRDDRYTQDEPEKNSRAFMAATAIRYFDNFIDEVLWPNISKFSHENLEKIFHDFLIAALATVRIYDQGMPDEIIRLPALEMDLTLHPTQENFNDSILDFVKFKSFDMAYIDKLLHGYKYVEGTNQALIQQEHYEKVSIRDIARDFYEGWARDVDFNLYGFIQKNSINPKKLRIHLDQLLQKNFPNHYKAYVLIDDTVDRNDVEWEYTLDESFFDAVINMRNKLLEEEKKFTTSKSVPPQYSEMSQ